MASPEIVPVSGVADAPFQPLVDVFARLVAAQGGGAALSVYRNGRSVVDLVAGDYRPDGLQLVFSVSKAVSAVAAAMLAVDGALDLDEPLADFWPEFDRASTRAITTRMVLSHRSGIASIDRELSFEELLDGAPAERAVETQEPYWEPGTAHGYHSFTFSPLLDGVFRRRVGRGVGQLVAERIAAPLGLDLWIGTPRDEWPRVERIHYSPARQTPARAAWAAESRIPPGSTGRLAATMDLFNTPELYGAALPSTTGIADARSLARLFAATLDAVDGVRLLDGAALRGMLAEQSNGIDRVLGVITAFGSGVQLPFPQFPLLGPGSFGHEAAGGSAVVVDPSRGISIGFTTNVHPPLTGAQPAFLALLPTIRHLLAD